MTIHATDEQLAILRLCNVCVITREDDILSVGDKLFLRGDNGEDHYVLVIAKQLTVERDAYLLVCTPTIM